MLSRQFGLSRRQAYRYLQEAQAIGHTVPVVAPSVPITLKMPADVVRDVRAYAKSGQPGVGLTDRRQPGHGWPGWMQRNAPLLYLHPSLRIGCRRSCQSV